MKNLLYFVVSIVLVTLAIFSCNSCYYGTSVPPINSSMLLDTSKKNVKDISKARSHYMRERVVSVRKKCKLKKEVTTITTTKDDIVIAIIHYGTTEELIVILGEDHTMNSRGTGTIIRSYEDASYISTAEHVIKLFDEDELEEKLDKIYDCKIYIQLDVDSGTSVNKIEVEVVAEDADMDLAILKVDIDLKVSSEFESDSFPGEVVWSSGYTRVNPDVKNVHMSITKGTLATVNVKYKKLNTHRVTSQIYYGNSGGPVWNENGELVGTSILMFGHRYDSDSFIPYEGAYYIRPVSFIGILAIQHQVYIEVFRE